MKTAQELDQIIRRTITQDIYPSKTNQYIKRFEDALKNRLLTYYLSEEEGIWETFEKEMLLNVAKTQYGIFKKTAGIEMFLMDRNIFIPLT